MDIQEYNIPIEVKDLTLPSPEEVTYWNLRKERVYWIDYEVDDCYMLMELAKEITRINIEEKDNPNPKPITLFLHSYGGDLDQSFYFCDLCETSHVPIITVATGVAMSAGLLIFLSGKRRYVYEHSQLLIHSGSAQFGGTAEQIEEAQKNYKKQIGQMKEYILTHTKIDEKLFNKNKAKDWYVTGNDIIELGIADKVIERFEDIQ